MPGIFLPSRLKVDLPRASFAVASLPGMGLAALLLWQPTAFAAEATSPREEELLEEVEVRGADARLSELRQEMSRLEEEIYARYNDLNKIGKYEVLCSDYARTGTRLERRYCRPRFEDDAKTEEGRMVLLARQQIMDQRSLAASVQIPESPVLKILAEMPAFQKNMREIVEKDPQVQRLLQERAAVAEQMQRTRRGLFGGP